MNRIFKDGLPEEGDIAILGHKFIIKLHSYGWQFFSDNEDDIDGEVVYDYRLEENNEKK